MESLYPSLEWAGDNEQTLATKEQMLGARPGLAQYQGLLRPGRLHLGNPQRAATVDMDNASPAGSTSFISGQRNVLTSRAI